ncbi:MAG: hypothetical protein D6813_14090, partial [Calditrichaeota bacterium]
MSYLTNIEISPTQIRRIQQYKDRWSYANREAGILEISEKLSPRQLKRFEIFQDYDDPFLEKISPDISLARWQKDAILFEEGSYIDLAFFIIHGNVEIYLHKFLNNSQLSRPRFDKTRIGLKNEHFFKKTESGKSSQDTVYHT